jgi:hypothetical protein
LAGKLFLTSKRIEWAWSHIEFFGLIIYGRQGIGKSTYMLKVMHDVYGDWDKVFKYLVFSLDDLIDIMKKAKESRIKVIGWDDAGVHGHKYLYFREKEKVELLSAWIDVVRTRIAGWLITTPDPRNLLKPVRESPGFYYGKVVLRGGGLARLVKVYERVYLPSGDIMVRKAYYDVFKARLPDDVYKEYMERRKAFYEEAEERLMEYIRSKESTDTPNI